MLCSSCVHDAVLNIRQCSCRSLCVISVCDSSPCQNGGTCTTSSSGGWQCTCPAQIEGATCNGASFCFILAFSVLDCASDSSLMSRLRKFMQNFVYILGIRVHAHSHTRTCGGFTVQLSKVHYVSSLCVIGVSEWRHVFHSTRRRGCHGVRVLPVSHRLQR